MSTCLDGSESEAELNACRDGEDRHEELGVEDAREAGRWKYSQNGNMLWRQVGMTEQEDSIEMIVSMLRGRRGWKTEMGSFMYLLTNLAYALYAAGGTEQTQVVVFVQSEYSLWLHS